MTNNMYLICFSLSSGEIVGKRGGALPATVQGAMKERCALFHTSLPTETFLLKSRSLENVYSYSGKEANKRIKNVWLLYSRYILFILYP